MKSVYALLTAGFIFFSLFDVNSHPTRQYKCCTRTDWEATIYGEGVGHTFDLGFLIWRNVTYRIAYSLSLNKCRSVFKTVGQLHPLLPIFTHFMITLDDYNKGIEYAMTSPDGSNCTREQTTTTQLRKLCIPGNATLLSRGSLADGNDTIQSTYRFCAFDQEHYPYTVTATVVETDIQGVCDPVHVTIYSRDEVQISLQDFNFFDVGPINSTDIFNAPKKCLK